MRGAPYNWGAPQKGPRLPDLGTQKGAGIVRRPNLSPIFVYENSLCRDDAKRGRPRTGSKPVVPVRLAAKQIKKIAELVELKGVDRSTVLRMLIDIGLNGPWVSLLMRRPGAKGRTATQRVIRAVVAKERVKVTQSAVLRAPSVKTEVNALRAEEEHADAMAAYDHHHHPKPPRSP